ncbi:hypothetical protein [Streptomyces sp. NPDC102360]|uniref:hypothetical protein n=1 Tax=Streptomyces sp. NPDC102360 TaxID=3366160 RepID=UPI00381C5A7E
MRPQAVAAAGAVGAVGTVGAAAALCPGPAGGHAREGDTETESGAALFRGLLVAVAVALGPVFLGIWMVRRAAAAGRSRTHGRLVLLLEAPWLAFLWARLHGEGSAWAAAFGTALGLATRYGLTLREERRGRRTRTP